jgi:hypothetical protein
MRSIRLLLLSLTFTIAMLLLAAANAQGVRAGEDPPSPVVLPVLATLPANPCADEPYALLALLPDCPACPISVRWEMVDPTHVRLAIRAAMCLSMAPCTQDTIRIPMPGLPRGWNVPLAVQVHSVLTYGDSASRDSVVVDTTLTHDVMQRPCDYIAPIPLGSRVSIDGRTACDSCPPVVACANRPIRVRISGSFSTGCGHVAKVELIPSMLAVIGPPTVRVLIDSDQCLGGPCTMFPKPWVVDTVIPGLPAGNYRLPVEVGQVSCSDSILPGRLERKLVAFQTSATCGPNAPFPALELKTAEPCVGTRGTLFAIVQKCPPCFEVQRAAILGPTRVRLEYRAFECATYAACPPDTARIAVGPFTANPAVLTVDVHSVLRLASGDSVVVDSTVVLRQPLLPTCGPPPIPLTARVTIGGQPAGGGVPPSVCADRPVAIHIAGAFPSSCGRVRKVEFLPSLLTVIGPPTVRVLLDSEDCFDRPCLTVMTPWAVDTMLPGLPLGHYTLPVEIAQVSCSDSILPGRIARQLLPFVTDDACTTATSRCFWPDWRPKAYPFQCALGIPSGGEDTLTFGVRSYVALAGLQGRLVTAPLEVKDIRPIGFARDMNLQWTRTDAGARFVLFATDGSVIPPYFDPLVDPIEPWPHLLRITVGLPEGVTGNAFRVDADSLLGADPWAQAVTACVSPLADAMPGGVLVCRQSGCDVNGDGHGDVRDLVLMVHCILGGGNCPDTTAGRFDCDGDGHASLDDILCCARTILRGAPRDSTPPVREPDVALRFGEPVRGADGVQLPLTLEGADHVGALRMGLRFPSDRYTVDGLVSSAGSGWLALHEVQGDQVVVGLIALSTPEPGATVPLTLRLALKPGQTDGGEVTVADAELSAPDGVALATDLPGTAVPITVPAELSLSVGPNPIAQGGATVRFGLPRATRVDVGVYDIAGRRVATLVQGVLPAGSHARTWDAADARDGVYFVRLRADGIERAHKAVLRRGR